MGSNRIARSRRRKSLHFTRFLESPGEGEALFVIEASARPARRSSTALGRPQARPEAGKTGRQQEVREPGQTPGRLPPRQRAGGDRANRSWPGASGCRPETARQATLVTVVGTTMGPSAARGPTRNGSEIRSSSSPSGNRSVRGPLKPRPPSSPMARRMIERAERRVKTRLRSGRAFRPWRFHPHDRDARADGDRGRSPRHRDTQAGRGNAAGRHGGRGPGSGGSGLRCQLAEPGRHPVAGVSRNVHDGRRARPVSGNLTENVTEAGAGHGERIEHTEDIHRTAVTRPRVDQAGILQGADGRARVGRAGPLVGDQVGHQQIGHRRPQPGHQVVAGVRGVAVVAAGDHVVIALGQHVEGLLGLGRAGAVQGRFARGRPALVDQRHQARPGRRRQARAADDLERIARDPGCTGRRSTRRWPDRRPARRRAWSGCPWTGRPADTPARARTG